MVTHLTPGIKHRVDEEPIAPRTSGSVPFLQKQTNLVLGAFLLIISSLLALAVVVVVMIPDNSNVLDYTERYMQFHEDTIVWESPYISEEVQTFELRISEEEFVDSFSDQRARRTTKIMPAPTNMLEPEDPYVKKIAEMLMEKTEGMSEWERAAVALNFVQTAVEYTNDDELYGFYDFWATPLETLFLQRGDCEDTAILLCSIYLAMGMDTVLLRLPEHAAVGVYVEGSDEYLYCETTCSTPQPPNSNRHLGPVTVCGLDYADGIREAVMDITGFYRKFIHDLTGI